jgi:hypothetical protein
MPNCQFHFISSEDCIFFLLFLRFFESGYVVVYLGSYSTSCVLNIDEMLFEVFDRCVKMYAF